MTARGVAARATTATWAKALELGRKSCGMPFILTCHRASTWADARQYDGSLSSDFVPYFTMSGNVLSGIWRHFVMKVPNDLWPSPRTAAQGKASKIDTHS